MWGTAGNGQLGANVAAASSPIQTVASGSNWKHISCGQLHTAAIKTDGTLWSWGHEGYSQLGNNLTGGDKSSAVQTVSGGTNWKQLSCGRYHTSAIKTDGTLWIWGRNNFGQLGDTSTTNRTSPVQTSKGGTNWKMVSAGGYHTVGLHFYEAGNLYPNTI
jgi:alpha-tubulin suppressor-like RCC1 family protein